MTKRKPVWHPLLTAVLAVLCAAGTASGADDAGSATYSVVITGQSGEKDYEKIMTGWGKDLSSTLRKSAGDDRVFWLAEKKDSGVYAESRQEQITKLFQTLAQRVRQQDVFQLFLIGHGSFDEVDYRINLPGPDVTAAQLRDLLARIPAERQLIVNMTSSSGGSLAALQRKGRVVITATTAGMERNFSQFPRYFIAALQEPAADENKNQEISALEAFRYATREVGRYYDSLTKLATEHALLEDRGEGPGVREPSGQNSQGLLAAALPLVRMGGSASTLDTPEVRSVRAEKLKAEEEIEALKYKKPSMSADDYSEQLEQLLINLSKVQQRLDTLEK